MVSHNLKIVEYPGELFRSLDDFNDTGLRDLRYQAEELINDINERLKEV